MFARELGGIGNRRLVYRRAEQVGQFGCLAEGVMDGQLLPGDDHRPVRREEPLGEARKRFIGGAVDGVDAHRAPHVHLHLLVEHVARQADEHRAGGRRQRDLGRAMHDAREVFRPRDVDRPFHERLGHGHQRRIEQRLEQAVPLLLLPGGQDHRRA